MGAQVQQQPMKVIDLMEVLKNSLGIPVAKPSPCNVCAAAREQLVDAECDLHDADEALHEARQMGGPIRTATKHLEKARQRHQSVLQRVAVLEGGCPLHERET